MSRARLAAILLLISAGFLFTGCGPKPTTIVSDSFYQRPVREVAVLSEAKLLWPRLGGGEPILGISISKQALGFYTDKNGEVFGEKGYEVVFIEPVAVGYLSNETKSVDVVEAYPEDDDLTREGRSPKHIEGNDPVYEYPVVTEAPEFGRAVRAVFEGLETEGKSYVPSRADVETVAGVTGGDMVCFNRLAGTKYTKRRHVTAAVVPFAPPAIEIAAYGIVCAHTTTGTVLFRSDFLWVDNPLNPNEHMLKKVLEGLPPVMGTAAAR